MNVFVNACEHCGQAAPGPGHLVLSCDVAKEKWREKMHSMAALWENAENTEEEDEDFEPPVKFVSGGLPSLGKRR